MTYITGQLTDANAPAALYALMEPAFISAGYTLEDTVIIGTRTHKVWKSPALLNAEGKDWYLDVAYTTTGTGSIWLGAFETYDVGTHTAGFGPFTSLHEYGMSGLDATEGSRFGATKYALETNWSHISGGLGEIPISTSAMGYWISITADRVIAVSSASSTNLIYCGIFESSPEWVDACEAVAPGKVRALLTSRMDAPAATRPTLYYDNCGVKSAITRALPNQADQLYFWSYSITLGPQVLEGGSKAAYAQVDTGIEANSAVTKPQPVGERLGIWMGYRSMPKRGYIGEVSDVARFKASAAVSRGDTITIDGQPWVLATQLGGYCFAFKAS